MAWLRKGRIMGNGNKPRRDGGSTEGRYASRDGGSDVGGNKGGAFDDAPSTPGAPAAGSTSTERDSRGAGTPAASGVEGVHGGDVDSPGANRDSRTN